MSIENKNPRIGDVYMVEFTGVEHEQSGIRPALIFQNNVGNVHSPNVIVLPLTSKIKKTNMPTHVFLHARECGLSKHSIVMCESPMTISKNRLENYVTTIPEKYLSRIAAAHILSTSSIAFLDINTVCKLMEKAEKLNK